MKTKFLASSVAFLSLATLNINSSFTAAQAQKLFWTDITQQALYSANLDGSGAMEILDLTTLGPGGFIPTFITIIPSSPESVPEPNNILGLIDFRWISLGKK